MNENSHTYALQYDVLKVKKIIRVYLVNADGIIVFPQRFMSKNDESSCPDR